MVENTVKQKKKPFWEKTLFIIAGGVFISLAFSVYFQFGNMPNFVNPAAETPEFIDMKNVWSSMQGKTENTADPYKYFSTPDGYLTVKYPSSFNDGQKVVEETTGTPMDPNNSLLFAYKVDLTATKMIPSSLIIARYDASSTEEVIGLIEQALKRQDCQSDIGKTEKEDDDRGYELFDSTYKCGDEGDLSLWQARIAVIQKNEHEFYTVTGATISKNWDMAKLEINSIFDSIAVTPRADDNQNQENENGNTDNNNQKNEIPEQ